MFSVPPRLSSGMYLLQTMDGLYLDTESASEPLMLLVNPLLAAQLMLPSAAKNHLPALMRFNNT